MDTREFQVVIFGATGFAGELLAEYFTKFYLRGNAHIKFAIGGRNKAKLEAVRDRLCIIDGNAKGIPIVLGDSSSMEDMQALAQRADVVATTAGPYALYGSVLVEACAAVGTSYCDLTGEGAWVDQMYSRHHRTAEDTGAHIVPCAGFDSVPSDLGTFLVAQQFKQDYGFDCDRVDNYVVQFEGGFQGGTINTIMNELSNPTKKPPRDPNAPAPEGKTAIDWTKGLWYDSRIGKWTVPFFMTPTNAPVVRRSNAQVGFCPSLTFRESLAFPFPVAAGWAVGMVLIGCGLLFPPTRYLIRKLLPDSGQGPTREQMLKSNWRMVFVASKDDKETRMEWNAKGDPSCIATTIYIAETAITLALNRGKLALKGGVLTPTSACGNHLWQRLSSARWDKDGVQHVTMSKL